MDDYEYPEVAKTFEDFAECTEYYYNELGKLSCVDLKRKEYRRMRKQIWRNMQASLRLLKSKDKLQNEFEQKFISDLHMTYKKPNIFSKIKKLFHKKEDRESNNLPCADKEEKITFIDSEES